MQPTKDIHEQAESRPDEIQPCAPHACDSPASLAASAPRSLAGSHSGAGVRVRLAGWLTAPRYLPGGAKSLSKAGRTPPGSPWLAGTFARYSGCLASASLPGSGRRCRLARACAALATSLDFLQGTFEKIHLQHLVGKHSLQVPNLLAELPDRRLGPAAGGLRSLLLLPVPVIEHGSVDAQLLGQRRYATAILHPLQCLLAKRLRVFSSSPLAHLQFLSLPIVARNSVSF